MGVFGAIAAQSFPASHGPATLYGKLTECEGRYDLRVDYVQVSTQKVLNKVTATLTSFNRLGYAEFDIDCPVLSIPEAGEYEFNLWMNDKFISRIRFDAVTQNVSEGRS